jgi:hypothetical protein
MDENEGSCHERRKMFMRALSRCENMQIFRNKTKIPIRTAQNIKFGITGIGKSVLEKLLRFEEENPGDQFFYANNGRCQCGASLQGRKPKARFCSHKCQRAGKENG